MKKIVLTAGFILTAFVSTGECGPKDNSFVQHQVFSQNKSWNALTEEEKERVKENYYRFQNMTPQKREDLRRRYDSYKKLSPEKRQQALELYKKWQNLPEKQQQKIRKKAGNLKHLPPREREKALKKSPNWQELSDEEQKVLRDTLYRD